MTALMEIEIIPCSLGGYTDVDHAAFPLLVAGDVNGYQVFAVNGHRFRLTHCNVIETCVSSTAYDVKEAVLIRNLPQ